MFNFRRDASNASLVSIRFAVFGHLRREVFDIVRDPIFSPDGNKIGFGARKSRELWWKVMVAR